MQSSRDVSAGDADFLRHPVYSVKFTMSSIHALHVVFQHTSSYTGEQPNSSGRSTGFLSHFKGLVATSGACTERLMLLL